MSHKFWTNFCYYLFIISSELLAASLYLMTLPVARKIQCRTVWWWLNNELVGDFEGSGRVFRTDIPLWWWYTE